MDSQSPLAAFEAFGPATSAKLTRTQKIVAKRMMASWTQIPHVTHNDEADISALEAHRKSRNRDDKHSVLVYLIKAVAASLRTFPQFNVSLAEGGDELIQKDYVHIGIAVDVPGGLLVPVLRDCDRRAAPDLATELREVSELARTKGVPFDRMAGGCFTISSLGGIGGSSFSPIINPPEVAILGVSKATTRPVWNGHDFEPRQMLPLSLSYDHRVINGADAARFCRHVSDLLAVPEELV